MMMAVQWEGVQTKGIRAHPAAEVFPMLLDAELRGLADDIKKNGLREPIVTYEENGETFILDGRNRARACELAGVEPLYTAFTGEPFALVVSANIHRRHLSVSQRAMAADKLARLRHGQKKAHVTVCNGSERSMDHSEPSLALGEAAALLNVSEGSVRRARVVRERGVPELAAAVTSGALSVRTAADIASRPEKEQRARLAGGVAKEVAPGVVRMKKASGEPQTVHPSKKADDHKRVRELTEQGFTVSDIAAQTGLEKMFIYHAKRQFTPKKGVLAGAIEDAELFAACWSGKAKSLPHAWADASTHEKESLIKALDACRVAAAKVIQRLKKEASQGDVAS